MAPTARPSSSACVIQPAGSTIGRTASGSGGGRTTPLLTQSVLCPRHCMAAMPSAHWTPSSGESSASSGCDGGASSEGGACGACGSCRQQGIVQSGPPVQQDAGFFFGGALGSGDEGCCVE